LDFYTTCYNISQIAIFDWTLSTSDHTTPPTELSVIVGFSLYSLGSDHTENKSIFQQRISSIVAHSLPRNVFTESLPSNGSVHHIVYSSLNDDLKTGLLLTPLDAGFLPQSLWFNPGKLHVKFVMDEVAVEQALVSSSVSPANHHSTIAPYHVLPPPEV
jgi:hypothetical protein